MISPASSFQLFFPARYCSTTFYFDFRAFAALAPGAPRARRASEASLDESDLSRAILDQTTRSETDVQCAVNK